MWDEKSSKPGAKSRRSEATTVRRPLFGVGGMRRGCDWLALWTSSGSSLNCNLRGLAAVPRRAGFDAVQPLSQCSCRFLAASTWSILA